MDTSYILEGKKHKIIEADWEMQTDWYVYGFWRILNTMCDIRLKAEMCFLIQLCIAPQNSIGLKYCHGYVMIFKLFCFFSTENIRSQKTSHKETHMPLNNMITKPVILLTIISERNCSSLWNLYRHLWM